MPRIVCLSDTHNEHDKIVVPDGDILLHAGDATNTGKLAEVSAFARWYEALPHKHKIFVAGNHDWLFERSPELAEGLFKNTIYLRDSSAEIEGLKIYGSPWQPWFFDWAFNLPRGGAIAEKWALIPRNTDILITHGPPQGILDTVPNGMRAGCEELIKVVPRIKPKLHLFGHIHNGYGTHQEFGVRFVNAANCDEAYLPVNPPIVIDL